MSTTKTAVPASRYLTSQMYTLDTRRLSSIVAKLIPSATLGPVVEIPSTQLPRLYELTLSDGKKLLLSFAPSSSVRLLRQEMALLKDEALLVDFIRGVGGGAGVGNAAEAGSLKMKDAVAMRIPPALNDLVPRLLKHSSDTKDLALPYSVFEPVAGTPLRTMVPQLRAEERKVVDGKIGALARSLAEFISPSGRFGIVGRVLPDTYTPRSRSPSESKGSKTWSNAFNSLLEGILRDGEDLAVLLPYEVIRAHSQRLSWCLDEVTVPRLVVPDAGSHMNVMFQRHMRESVPKEEAAETVRLTGLRCWGRGMFGDPLMCDAFEDPSADFMHGWREGGEDIIEDAENTESRVLLYRCYRAVMSIVTEYYRPVSESSKRELEGRRKLTSALKELEKVDLDDNEALKRVRSMPISADASKRQKVSDDES